MLLSRLRPARVLPACTCRCLSTSSPLAAPFHFTSLPSRAILPISGKDATKLLQGLVSNDVSKLGRTRQDGKEERALYSVMLKADGRMLHDIFLYQGPQGAPTAENEPPTPSFLLDHPSSASSTLRTYLKRHILRSKVKLPREVDPEQKVFAAWRNAEEEVSEEQVKAAADWLEGTANAGEDKRVDGMGWRWSARVGEAAAQPPESLFSAAQPAQHHLQRLLLAVPEGPSDFAQLPQEANVDFMGAVDFKKGCYVGQELTARTHHKGVVRKRGVGLRLFREGEDVPDTLHPDPPLIPYPGLFPVPPPGSTLTPLALASPRARPSGKLGSALPVLSRSGLSTVTLAFGSVRLEHLEGDALFEVKPPKKDASEADGAVKAEGEMSDDMGAWDEEGVRWFAKAFKSEWLAQKVAEEAEGKQK